MNTTIKKPWGSEEILLLDRSLMVKRLTMMPGKRCSLQKHALKLECIICESGILTVEVHEHPTHIQRYRLKPQDSLVILPGTVHRMSVLDTDLLPAVYTEASTPHPDDVIRLEDDYGRA